MSPATIDLAIRASVDASKAEAGLHSLGDAADRMADDITTASRQAEKAGRNLDSVANAADGVASKGSILAGAMGDIGGGLEAAGLGGFGTALQALATPLLFIAGLGDLLSVSMESLSLASLKAKASLVAQKAASIAAATAEKAQAAATWALNAAMDANPIGLIIVSVVALIAGLVLLYKHSAKFRTIVQKVGEIGRKAIGWVVDKIGDLVKWVKDKAPAAFNVMKTIAVKAFNAIPLVFIIKQLGNVVDWVKDKLPAAWNTMKTAGKTAWNALTAPIRGIVNWVQSLIDKIANIHWPEPPGWVKDIGSAIGGLIPGRAVIAPSASTSASSSTDSGSTQIINYNININGAVDPMSTARQIDALIGSRARILGVG